MQMSNRFFYIGGLHVRIEFVVENLSSLTMS